MGVKTKTSFGPNNAGKPKGVIHKKTKIKQAIGLTGWEKLGKAFEGELADKMLEEIKKLKGKDYTTAMALFAEYFKPKLNRTTLEGGDKPIETKTTINWGGRDIPV